MGMWEVRSTGGASDNGGGFHWVGCTFPTDGAATVATGNSPVFTSASYTFVSADVGAWLFIKDGTNARIGMYPIISVSAGAATLGAAIGQGYTMTKANAYDGTMAVGGPALEAGIATTASPTGLTWGVDYSNVGTGPQFTFTDMVISGVTNTNFTSAAFPVGKNFIGNVINITSGTGFTVQRVIVVSTSGTTATCNVSLGTLSSTGGNGKLGGALDSISTASNLGAFEQENWWCTGDFSITAAITFDSLHRGRWRGYGTVRGDRVKARIRATATIATGLLSLDGRDHHTWSDFDFDANDYAAKCWNYATLNGNNLAAVFRCRFHHATGVGVNTEYMGTRFYDCEFDNNNGGGVLGANVYVRCYIHDNTGDGIGAGYGAVEAHDCILANNTGDGSRGVEPTRWYRCLAYGNSGNGFSSYGNSGTSYWILEDCIAWGNGGYGYRSNYLDGGAPESYTIVTNFAAGSNTSGRGATDGFNPREENGIVLTADPCIDAASGDFRLNNTAGGGALCRNAALSEWTGLTAVSYRDVGPLQSSPPVKLDDDAANDVLDNLHTIFPASSVLDIYDAAGPADPNSAHTGNILVSFNLPSSPWASASGGSMSKNNTWSGTAIATGVPVSARLRNATDTKRMDFTCTESGGTGEVTIDTASITTGQTVTINTFTVTA